MPCDILYIVLLRFRIKQFFKGRQIAAILGLHLRLPTWMFFRDNLSRTTKKLTAVSFFVFFTQPPRAYARGGWVHNGEARLLTESRLMCCIAYPSNGEWPDDDLEKYHKPQKYFSGCRPKNRHPHIKWLETCEVVIERARSARGMHSYAGDPPYSRELVRERGLDKAWPILPVSDPVIVPSRFPIQYVEAHLLGNFGAGKDRVKGLALANDGLIKDEPYLWRISCRKRQ